MVGRERSRSPARKEPPDENHTKQGTSGSLLPDSLNKAIPDKITQAQQQLQELTRASKSLPEVAGAEPPSFKVGLPCRRTLTDTEKTSYHRDGFVICRGWYSAEEVGILSQAIQNDHNVDEQKIAVKDTDGRNTKLTLWWYLGDDTYGQFGRSASLVQAASDLMAGSEPYHSHTKVLLKEPLTGGAWEWHQDFGYWYSQGIQHPDKIINAVIAVDQNTPENGCMRLLTRSHTLGRIEHGTFGGQAGADPERVVAAMKLPGYDVVILELKPGDVAFMHSNTLHASAPNESRHWRRNMICAYNSRHNEPLDGSPEGQPAYNAINIVSDDNIVTTGVRNLDPALNKMLSQ